MSARRAKRGNRKRSRARETSEMGEPTCQVSFWGQPMEIPPPLDAEDVRKGPCPDFIAPKAWESLQNLWTRFLKKKNRNVPFVWKPPTPIQLQSWSFLLSTQAPPQHAGQVSLLQMAPTGCGKTMAYAAPLLLVEKKNKRCSAVVVLVPTRELALQVQAECERAAGSNKNSKRMRLLALYGGGTKKADHIASLQECRDLDQSVLIAATPGRFLDILRASTIDSKDTEASLPATKNESNQRELVSWLCEHTATVVLDEADRLAVQTDLCQQVDAILQHFRHRSRTILCSATWPQKANYVWKQWIGDQHPCVVLQVDALSLSSSSSNAVKKELTVGSEMDGMGSATEQKDMSLASSSKELTLKETIAAHPAADWVSRIPTHLTQTVHVCSQHKKPRKLLTTLTKIHQGNEKHRQQPRGIVFFAKIQTLEYCWQLLHKKQGMFRCGRLHSHMRQVERERAVQNFRAGKCPVLLASDLAARGLHVDGIRFVIQYDFPSNLEQYVHRCGRAGRDMTVADAVAVYSFFTRPLAPMAADLVSLLRATNQWVDPNLLALVQEAKDNSTLSKGRKRRKHAGDEPRKKQARGPAADRVEQPLLEEDNELDDDVAFGALSGNRIVLKRASNVSDPSSSDSDGDV